MSPMTAPARARRQPSSRRASVATTCTRWLATLALAAGATLASAPQAHAVHANSASALQAWGNNDYGQTQLPADLRSGLKVVDSISLGEHQGVAATTDKKLYAWGDNTHGEGSVPDYLQNLGTIDVAAGDGFNVVLGDDYNIRVWGNTPYSLDSVPQVIVDGDVSKVAAGHDHALALMSTGKVAGWGRTATGATLPPTSVILGTMKDIAAGNGFSVALSTSGKVYAWGDNTYGAAKVPSSLDNRKVVQIAAGEHHALALTEDGEIVGWGSNAEGALNIPALAPGDKWLQITAGDGFSAGTSLQSPVAGVWGSGATGVRQPPAPSGSNAVSVVAGGDFLVQGFRRLGVASAPTVTTQPGGVFRAGTPIYATHATFGPVTVTKTGQWLKVTNEVVSTVGAGLTYTPTNADIGSTLVFRTNADSGSYGTAFSDTPQIQVKGRLFTSISKPRIAGNAYVGSTLTAVDVTTVPATTTYRYDWYADGIYRKTSDARGEYVVQGADRGKRITVLVYADKEGYERIQAETSDATPAVSDPPETPGFQVQSPPRITGTPMVGTTLTVTAPVVLPSPGRTTYQWYRDGVAISGATGDRYAAGPADAGRTLDVVATLSGAGRKDATSRSGSVTVANASPAITWKAKQVSRSGAKRKVRVSISISAPGVPALGGQVTIRDGGKVVKTLTLVNGQVSGTVKLKRGKRKVTVTYDGTTGVSPASAATKVRVK